MILAYQEWRKGLHSCGHHLSEARIDPSNPARNPPVYQAHLDLCAPCLELEVNQHEQAKEDEEKVKAGKFVPRLARLWRVIKIN